MQIFLGTVYRKYAGLLAGKTTIRFPMTKLATLTHALGADWTPAAGDVKISLDGGVTANVTNLPTAVAMGTLAAFWEFVLTAAELTCGMAVVTIADAASGKAVEDACFVVETFGHASAQTQWDPTDAVRQGMTAVPNAAPGASGGLPTVDGNNMIKGLQRSQPEFG